MRSHHLVSDKVVDSINLLLFPSIFGDSFHHFLCTGGIFAEWLFDDQAIGDALVVVLVQLVGQGSKLAGRYSKLKREHYV